MWSVFSLGEGHAGLPFHSHGAAWLGVVHGRKHWFLYPPGAFSPSDRAMTSPLAGVKDWTSKVYPKLAAKPIECTQQPGEVLFVPTAWLHATLNLGETVAVGGQLEWDPTMREAGGRTVLKDHPGDFQGHKDVAVSLGTSLKIPQHSQHVLREVFGASRIPILLDETAEKRLDESASHFDAAIAMQPQDIPLHKMACDLFIVKGDPVAVLRYATLMADALGITAPAAPRPQQPKESEGEPAAVGAVPALLPVSASIGAAGRSSVMDYAMTATTIAKVQKDWPTTLRGLLLAARVAPNDGAVIEGIAEAKAAMGGV